MAKYHEIAKTTSSQSHHAAAPSGRDPLVGLAQKYGHAVHDMFVTDTSDLQMQTVEQEFQSYVTGHLSNENIDIVKYWEVCIYSGNYSDYSQANLTSQLNETVFPMLFKIAMDYLPIQASSVPSERVFSSSSETDTKKRNRIHPLLMEAPQMLKFALKKDHMNFMRGWVVEESMLAKLEAEGVDLLVKLLGEGNPEEVIDEIIRGFGQD